MQDHFEQASNDYATIAKAIRYIEAHQKKQPGLAEVAASVHLSEFHFQRLFTRWTGTSPKRLVSALTHAAARQMLVDGRSVLDVSLETGLSGPGRLHDIFIAEEAVSPGQVKTGGQDVVFRYGQAASPFGTAIMLLAPKGLSGLAFADPGEEQDARDDLTSRFPKARMIEDNRLVEQWAERIFSSGPDSEPIPVALYGTPWRRQVWRALLSIPPGKTVSYRDIAIETCSEKASRAVGAAVGANPVSWLIPCHRVLASNGLLTGYHWGVNRKRAMLAYEAAID